MRRRPVLWVAIVLLGIFVYDAVLRSLAAGFVALPSVPGGLKVLTAVLAVFSLTHAWYALGGRLTATFFAVSAVVSWAYEQVGVMTGLVFGAYHYTDYLGAKLGDVPLLIPLAWFMMIYPSYVVANLAIEGRPFGTPPGILPLIRLAAASAVAMTVWDLVVDPILSGPSAKAWIWETGGPYYGIPIQNYAGWLVTTFTVYMAYRAVERSWGAGAVVVAESPGRGSDSTDRPIGRAELPIGRAVAAMPLAAYGLMLISDLVSGQAPSGLVAIGLVAMGIPLALAVCRLATCRPAARRPVAPRPAVIADRRP